MLRLGESEITLPAGTRTRLLNSPSSRSRIRDGLVRERLLAMLAGFFGVLAVVADRRRPLRNVVVSGRAEAAGDRGARCARRAADRRARPGHERGREAGSRRRRGEGLGYRCWRAAVLRRCCSASSRTIRCCWRRPVRCSASSPPLRVFFLRGAPTRVDPAQLLREG